jgi:hypothetical protein
MTNGPLLINLAGIQWFMVPMPQGFDKDMTPPRTIFDGEVEFFIGNDENTCFFVLMQSDRIRTEDLGKKIQAGLEYIWGKSVQHGSATGPMPEVITVDPHDLQRMLAPVCV